MSEEATIEVGSEETLARAEALNNGEYDSSNPPTEEQLAQPEAEPEDALVEGYDEDEEEYEEEEDTEGSAEEADESSIEEDTEDDAEDEELFFNDETLAYIQQEYEELGGLSQETADAIMEAGIPQSMLDTYIAGLSAIEQVQVQQVHQMVGGEEQYNQLTAWAANNLSDAEVQAFNGVVMGNDMNATMLALQGLQARYEGAFGSTGGLTLGGTQPQGATDVFQDTQEVIAAMDDPRYGKDMNYTRSIEAKVRRSNVF